MAKIGGNTILGLFLMLLIAGGLRYVYGFVSRTITVGNIGGLVLWQDDWNDALSQAAAQHKPLLVEFVTASNPACHELAKKAWSRPDIVFAMGDYVPVMVDIDAHPDLTERYGVTEAPSLLVVDVRTQRVMRDGRGENLSPDQLLTWLKPEAQPNWNFSTPQVNTFDSQGSFFNSAGN